MRRVGHAVGRNEPLTRSLHPNDEMPPRYWDAVLRDAGAGDRALDPEPRFKKSRGIQLYGRGGGLEIDRAPLRHMPRAHRPL
ncbi:hypothetical protein ABIF66_002387 [Bradyrhizobium japonicum]